MIKGTNSNFQVLHSVWYSTMPHISQHAAKQFTYSLALYDDMGKASRAQRCL